MKRGAFQRPTVERIFVHSQGRAKLEPEQSGETPRQGSENQPPHCYGSGHAENGRTGVLSPNNSRQSGSNKIQ